MIGHAAGCTRISRKATGTAARRRARAVAPVAALVVAPAALAAPPLMTEDAETAGKGELEIEGWASRMPSTCRRAARAP